MKTFTTFALTLSILATAFASDMPKFNFLSEASARNMLDTIKKEGCNVNICFALDGSGSVSQSEFDLAKFFAQDVANLVGTNNFAEFAAAQFGRISYPISPLTSDRLRFADILENTKSKGDSATSMGAGIVFCDFQLSKRVGDANKMVVIGDGRNSFGGSPVRRANNFRRRDRNGDLCTVGVGYKDTRELLKVAGGDKEKVLTVDDYIQLGTLVNKLVLQVCGVELA